jgi:hypothetical protein
MAQVKTETCKSGAPIQTGGRSSNTEVKTSSTFRTRRFLMLPETKIKKDKLLLSGRDIMDGTKDGELSIKIRLERSEERDTITDSVSTS